MTSTRRDVLRGMVALLTVPLLPSAAAAVLAQPHPATPITLGLVERLRIALRAKGLDPDRATITDYGIVQQASGADVYGVRMIGIDYDAPCGHILRVQNMLDADLVALVPQDERDLFVAREFSAYLYALAQAVRSPCPHGADP